MKDTEEVRTTSLGKTSLGQTFEECPFLSHKVATETENMTFHGFRASWRLIQQVLQ